MSPAVIKNYTNIVYIQVATQRISNKMTDCTSVKDSLYSFCVFLLLAIESEEKINGNRIIFNFRMKRVSEEKYIGRKGDREKDWKLD